MMARLRGEGKELVWHACLKGSKEGANDSDAVRIEVKGEN